MQEKKVWTLVALAMLTALTLVRPEPQLDGRDLVATMLERRGF